MAETQLAGSEERYRLLVNNLSDHALFMLDREGRVSDWTTAAERVTGYTAADIVGQPFATLFMPHDRERGLPERHLEIARATGKAEGSGWRVRKNGSVFWADEIATALLDAAGAHIGYSAIARDNTERRRADLVRDGLVREATESNRLKDVFLSTVSHELRTPLNAILGWVQLIRLREPGAASMSEGLAVIDRNARAQSRLIDDLLDVSRIVRGTTDLVMIPTAFAEPLTAAVETVRPTAEQKGVRLVVRHNAQQDQLLGDAERLQQIVCNLLTNAIKFTPAGGLIELDTSDRPDAIELTVTDSGAGIDPAFLPFVFERFRQGDTSHTREHRGLGLGLSIVKHLTELHGGRVVVESAGQGTGTAVRVTLPRLPAVSGAGTRTVDAVSTASAAPPRRRLTDVAVLVVDDDPDARRLLELALTAHGARVTGATSAVAGVAAAKASPPDIVLADLAMPAEDGFALLEQLRAAPEPALRSVPIVAITAHARAEDRARVIAAGFNEYMVKPVNLLRVVDVVRGLTMR